MTAPIKPLTPFERCMQPQPTSYEVDWIAQMERLAERDAAIRQMEAQEAWIKEIRAKIFRNVHDYPKAKK